MKRGKQMTEKLKYANGNTPLTLKQQAGIIKKATKAYEKYMDALGFDWRNDPNSMETPKRVAKAYVNDLWAGRYNELSGVTSFPSDGYQGIVLEKLTEEQEKYRQSWKEGT